MAATVIRISYVVMNIQRYYRKAFFRSLPTRSYLKLLIAIFFTFSTIGFVLDLWKEGQLPLWNLFLTVAYSGLIAVGFAHGVMRNWKLIPVVLLIQFTLPFVLPGSAASFSTSEIMESRLILDGFGILSSVILGYVFFVIFISGEGIPHVRLKTEMDLAKEMHDVLVPPIQYQNQHFAIYGKSIPTSEVGGDLLDFYETENSITCYTADVSGHGVAAGLFMGMFKSAMHTSLQSNSSLATVLNTVNKSLHKLKKASMFLTASAIRFNENKTAEFSVAGHLPILHYRAHSHSIQYLTIKQIPLSVQPDYKFSTETVSFESGDVFLFLTDGLTEVSNAKDEEFELERIEALLLRNASQPIEELFQTIITEIHQHGPQRDDQTMMIVRCIN